MRRHKTNGAHLPRRQANTFRPQLPLAASEIKAGATRALQPPRHHARHYSTDHAANKAIWPLCARHAIRAMQRACRHITPGRHTLHPRDPPPASRHAPRLYAAHPSCAAHSSL
ncbi:hypothetical protein BSIN_2290 [Burkholderia singularis]|uniref:Uncharacterized protein n=1 Tax=Burkholderia singularis TaxID=1503053 RepID=A0A238H1P8_9BURK|nr:hypothetical protein BSIN_2290 [Burkholderia singularis]